MKKNIIYTSPGTVSKILWHFTGGPNWNDINQKQEKRPKESQKAFDNLCSIIKSQKLQIGKYREVIHYKIPQMRYFNLNPIKPASRVKKNVPAVVESEPVCCVSEIPIQHLSYHSKRYGKFAIAFYRDSILKNNFNPVFYTLSNDNFISYLIDSYKYSSFMNKDLVSFSSHLSDIKKLLLKLDFENKKQFISKILMLNNNSDKYNDYVRIIEHTLKYFLAFIKTINRREFDTIYCEREWRSILSFKFDFKDVAMITFPKSFFKNNYSICVKEISEQLNIPRHVPIIAWEDLIEH